MYDIILNCTDLHTLELKSVPSDLLMACTVLIPHLKKFAWHGGSNQLAWNCMLELKLEHLVLTRVCFLL